MIQLCNLIIEQPAYLDLYNLSMGIFQVVDALILMRWHLWMLKIYSPDILEARQI